MPRNASGGPRPGGRGSSARLVFEIGTEELPPAAAWDGARQLREEAAAAFEGARVPADGIRAYSTPRRLALIAENVAARQQDLIREVRGPAVRAAFGPDGRPTQAAEGFAHAQGVPVTALERRKIPQGEYVFAIRREPGKPSAGVLASVLPALAGRLVFPKSMRWGTGSTRFARPVRWVLALLGQHLIPCEFAGMRAGRHTMGHRVLHPGEVAVASAETYETALHRGYVLVDPDERRRRITAAVARAARGVQGRPILDPDLVEETVQLVEWPSALTGRFAPEFLDLPREVLITVMQHHQKYFAVEDASGRLLPAFVAVRNGGARGLRIVREGNEWVLRARLADARFFFEDDRKRRLAGRVEELSDLVFHEKLGTMADKTRRLEILARRLVEILVLRQDVATTLGRAAHLSKADLVTHMVRELPELQGVMGGIYARLDGEPGPVADAIRQQYLPRGAVLPQTEAGAYLALLDKVDTLIGALAAGIVPSGSEDPYGLRRAAQGIVSILLDRGVLVDMRNLAHAALDAYGVPDAARRAAALDGALDLLRQRLKARLIEDGISYDTVDAALDAGITDLVEAAARARALWEFRREPAFVRLYTAFDRAARILPAQFDGRIDLDLIREPAERGLLEVMEAVRADLVGEPEGGGGARETVTGASVAARVSHRIAGALSAGASGNEAMAALAAGYRKALGRLSSLADPVDRFFTDVLVMADDPAVRKNRLALLAGVVNLVRPIANLSRVVAGEGKPVPRS
jgi:glycyl-tRNA synthetase beta chain